MSKHVFRNLYANCDDYINFKEFLCALILTFLSKTEEKFKLALNIYDNVGCGGGCGNIPIGNRELYMEVIFEIRSLLIQI